MKTLKIFIHSIFLALFGSCCSMYSFNMNTTVKSEFKKSLSLGNLNFAEDDSSNGDEMELDSPADDILGGDVFKFLSSLSNSIGKKKLDRNIIHSVIMSEYLDGVYDRVKFLVVTIDMLKAFCTVEEKLRFINNVCEVEFSNGDVVMTTPLNLALDLNYLDLAKVLIDEGASIDVPNDKGRYPMSVLAEKKYVSTSVKDMQKKRLLSLMTERFALLSNAKKLALLSNVNRPEIVLSNEVGPAPLRTKH